MAPAPLSMNKDEAVVSGLFEVSISLLQTRMINRYTPQVTWYCSYGKRGMTGHSGRFMTLWDTSGAERPAYVQN